MSLRPVWDEEQEPSLKASMTNQGKGSGAGIWYLLLQSACNEQTHQVLSTYQQVEPVPGPLCSQEPSLTTSAAARKVSIASSDATCVKISPYPRSLFKHTDRAMIPGAWGLRLRTCKAQGPLTEEFSTPGAV